MPIDNNFFFDLQDPLMFDTYLTVKYGLKWVHYNVPITRNNGTSRTYGDLYTYFTNQPDFKMAIGYIRNDSPCNQYWTAKARYFYFDKNQAPHLASKVLTTPLILKKSFYGKPKD